MRHSIFAGAALLFSGSVFGQVVPANNCAKNNCYRGVLGTAKGQATLQAHLNDCSSALMCTTTASAVTTTIIETVTPTSTVQVFTTSSTQTTTTTTPTDTATSTTTPPPVVVTTTVTPTVTVTTTTVSAFDKRGLGRRQGGQACSGFVVPSYAAACSGFARFSSVCSCAGITGTTTTVSLATVTTTSTLTLATTVVTQSNFGNEITSTVTSTAPAVTTTLISTLESSTTTTTTSASTVTTTSTTISSVPSPTCNNAGLQYAYYLDNQAAGPQPDNVRVDPTVVKTRQPVAQGTTTDIGLNIVNPQPGTTYPIYDTTQSGLNFILNHRGYFYAPESGTYTFTASNVDDIVYTWFQGTAMMGWSGSNTPFRVFFNSANTQRGTGSYVAYFPGGSYVPFRVIYKQSQGDAAFSYSITSPSGVTLASTGMSSAYLFQFSCDGTAPAYTQPFGAET